MAFYRICPDCGAYLDPGEQCSCHEECLIEMERKEKATVYATEQGLSGVFPRDADKVVPSVVTVSQLDKAPEIYRTTQKDTGKEKTALVRLEYSVRIAGSQTQRGNFIYKVTFNEESKKFTTIENLGEENQ